MKYLKKYKMFESSENLEEIRSECFDILQELVDDGFIIKCFTSKTYTNKNAMEITIENNNKFEFDDLSNEYNHLVGYLSEYNFIPFLVTDVVCSSYTSFATSTPKFYEEYRLVLNFIQN